MSEVPLKIVGWAGESARLDRVVGGVLFLMSEVPL